ncbi:MAG: hypothetical protein QUV05_24110 [Phycisphaerae bacterium]|jgi:hypothetical protein|nr:hypothetical protein [Phycisphaerae bacterium]
MKLAVLSESPADEQAVRILVEGLLGKVTEPAEPPPLRTRGWPSVSAVVPVVLKHLYYHTDAEAFVTVVDSNHSAIHDDSHDQNTDPGCRLCRLRKTIDQTVRGFKPLPQRSPLRIAVGLAVPAIEAWYRCGRDPTVSESAWIEGMRARRDPYSKAELKRAVYGTDRAPLVLMIQRQVEEARRLVSDLGTLEKRFPTGFGSLAREVRNWRS